jgi:hypothetical protein
VLNDLSDWVLSHWFPMGRSSHVSAGSIRGMGEAGPSRMKM